MKLAAPFPYFGGKARVAAHVWARFGDVQNYVEPFFGSGAVLLARPSPPKTETVNDLDGMVANFWRAVQAEPETVARYADWPVSELDLEARHRWLVGRKPELVQAVRTDPAYYEAKAAGWWVYGMSLWIGGDWCRKDVASSMTQVPYLKNGAMGVHSALRGVSTCAEATAIIHGRMAALADRLRRVRVCCGDWSRICGPSPTYHAGTPCGVFLDPPYGAERYGVYNEDSYEVAGDVRAWCLEQGKDSRLRIALCGYDGEHNELEEAGWSKFAWKANGGYANLGTGNGAGNAKLERIWFSPHCLQPVQSPLDLE